MAQPGYGKSIGFGNFQPGFRPVSGSMLMNAFARMLQGGIDRQDNITAKAGGGQATAVQLTHTQNRVTTVATAGDSVALPKAIAGSEVVVINAGANALQIFGKIGATDTLNGIAGATGLSMPPGGLGIFVCVSTGVWTLDGPGAGAQGNFPTVTSADALTAHAGGGQGAALAITSQISRVTTVATAADSVVLPLAKAGMQLTIINAAAANAMNVFPAVGDAINALGANTAISVAANKTMQFYAAKDGLWHSILTA